MTDGGHVLDRAACRSCGKCADECLGEALTLYGRRIAAADAVELLVQDREFYANSGGGVTLSGGEPLMQAAFTAEVFRLLHAHGVRTALDTCGYAGRDALDAVLPHTDRILYDVKAADDGVHRALTGRSNAVILDNLTYCGTWQIPIEIRIPLIPGANDGEIPAIGALLAKNPVFDSVRVLPYHAYAHSKYDALGMTYPGKDYIVPTRDMMVRAVDTLRGCGLNAFSPALTD